MIKKETYYQRRLCIVTFLALITLLTNNIIILLCIVGCMLLCAFLPINKGIETLEYHCPMVVLEVSVPYTDDYELVGVFLSEDINNVIEAYKKTRPYVDYSNVTFVQTQIQLNSFY